MFDVTVRTTGGTFCDVHHRAKSTGCTRPSTHDGIVANAGLILPATLIIRPGLEALIDPWVKTGSSCPGRKILSPVSAMLAGATHIDHVNLLRAGATERVLPFEVMAPSTIGSFLRSFTFGHVRQLDAVLSRTLGRAWAGGAAPGDGPPVVDLDSTICEGPRQRNRPPATATPKSWVITHSSPPEPGPVRSCSPGCGGAQPTPPAVSSVSSTNSSACWTGPALPGR